MLISISYIYSIYSIVYSIVSYNINSNILVNHVNYNSINKLMHNRIKRNFEILIKDDKYELNIYKNLYQIFLKFFSTFKIYT